MIAATVPQVATPAPVKILMRTPSQLAARLLIASEPRLVEFCTAADVAAALDAWVRARVALSRQELAADELPGRRPGG